jgi:hypothetical protein
LLCGCHSSRTSSGDGDGDLGFAPSRAGEGDRDLDPAWRGAGEGDLEAPSRAGDRDLDLDLSLGGDPFLAGDLSLRGECEGLREWRERFFLRSSSESEREREREELLERERE